MNVMDGLGRGFILGNTLARREPRDAEEEVPG